MPAPGPRPFGLACGLAACLAIPSATAQTRDRGVEQAVPLPQPRPPWPPPAESEPAALVGPPACYFAFAERGGVALPVAPAAGDPACAIDEPVTFRSLSMPGGSRVELDAAATLRCAFAVELLDWLRSDLPAAIGGATVAALTGVGGQACRPRNGVAGGVISEHATGNALDLGGLRLQDGRTIRLTDRDGGTLLLRQAIHRSACSRFRTVLGPGSDAFHRDHIHFDSRKRPGGFRICQWLPE